MCEFTDNKHKMSALNFFNTLPNSNMVFGMVRQRLPNAFNPAHCAVCGKYLSEKERRPRGRATRSMCVGCYENNIANHINYSCFLCGMALPEDKVQAQRGNRRELKHHIHDSVCVPLWTIIHNVAVAEPDIVPQFKQLPHHKPGPVLRFDMPRIHKEKPIKVLSKVIK